jgi:hypothetical protein
MNALPRAITARFFARPDDYALLQRHWSALMNSARKHELAAAHHILYLALLGKDWRKGFAPITNRRKLDNGAFWGWTLFRALRSLQREADEEWLLAPFAGLVTAPMLQRVRSVLPAPSPYSSRPEEYGYRTFPFDAYLVPDAMIPASQEDPAHA